MISIWLAVLLDAIAGDPYWFPHPVRFIGSYITSFEGFTRRVVKSKKWLRLAGVLLTFTAVIITYGASFLILYILQSLNIWLFYGVNLVLMYTCLAARCLTDEAVKLYRVLAAGDMEKARKMLSYIVGRDTVNLGESEITRATVETVAENASDGVIAPLFYMFLGGAPLALAYKAVNTLDSMVGYRNEKYEDLGWASAKLDDIANFIPARLTAIFMVIAAFVLRLDWKSSWRVFLRDRRNHKSPNSGCPESATAGALGVQLGGTNMYFGKAVVKPTIGDNNRLLVKEDIISTIKLMYTASIISTICFSLIWMLVQINGGLL